MEIIGIVDKAVQTKNDIEMMQEKQIVSLAYKSVVIRKISNLDYSAVTQNELNSQLRNQGASASGNNPIIVTFENSKRQYEVQNNRIVYIGKTDNDNDENNDESDSIDYNDNMILSYKTNQINVTSQKNMNVLYDLTDNNNDAVLQNISLNDDNDGLVFNGSSSGAKLNLQSTLSYPITVEMDISTQNTSSSIIYIEPNSKIAFGINSGYFICTANNQNNFTYYIPSNFFDGNIKHIVVVYNSIDNYEVFVNGESCVKSSAKNYWTPGVDAYIGRRNSGTYFNGTLYSFKIYNRIFNSNEYISTNNRNNLILEYDISNNNCFSIEENREVINLIDSINKNNVLCYNIGLDENNGMIFNGYSSYIDFDIQSELEFPFTIEMDISTTNNLTSIIYIDPNTKIAFGYVSRYFILTTNTNKKATYDIPEDFFDGNIKNIVVIYNSLDDYEVFVNGEKCSLSNNYDFFTSNDDNSYIGKRNSSSSLNYFQGKLYTFNIYNCALPEDIIITKYNNNY